MGAPANQGYIPVVNGLNFNAPRVPATTTRSRSNDVDVDSILGLQPSEYTGLQKVGDTGYFYGNNRMYEPYTTTSTTMYGNPVEIMMGRISPTTHPDARYGVVTAPKPSYESITVDGQEFRTVSPDIDGFNKTAIEDDNYEKDSVYEYTPSTVSILAKSPKYKGTDLTTSNPLFSLIAPSSVNYAGGFGAGRFLGGTDGILGGLVDSADNG